MVALRHDLHSHPELGFEEHRTSEIVAAHLAEAGLAVDRGLGGTGVVGTLRIGSGERTIALRADMDALAMPEVEGRPHGSRHDGVMHACGHDGHTAMLLGAARYLACTRGFDGTVHFIFQPAEEGRGGARRMLADGMLDRHPCDAIYGLHNMPGLPIGSIAVVPGAQLASSDSWRVQFRGVGTHGAKPHLGRDPITAAATFISSLQSIVGRVVDPLQSSVISACSVQAGNPAALNVIPETINIGGTARAYSPAVRDQLDVEIGRLAEGCSKMFGIECSYDFERRNPPVINDRNTTLTAQSAARSVFGDDVRTEFPPSTAGDDFALFGQLVPACYAWLGNGAVEESGAHHSETYDFNDAALGFGAAYWAAVVNEELGAASGRPLAASGAAVKG